jgi:competence protein ComEA
VWLAPLPGRTKDRPPAAPLDLNRATASELEQLPGIGPARAAVIVRIRERNGPFRSVEELRALPRLSEKQFRELLQYVTVVEPDQGEPGPGGKPSSSDSKSR